MQLFKLCFSLILAAYILIPGELLAESCSGKGKYWDSKYKQCLSIIKCKENYAYSTRLKKCYKKTSKRKSCKKGEWYDKSYDQCLYTKPGCKKGYAYSTRLKACYVGTKPLQSVTCPKGQFYDKKYDQCLLVKKCPSQYTWS